MCIRMMGRASAVLALAGSSAAFSPMMSIGEHGDMRRREVVKTVGAAVVAAPLLRSAPAAAKVDRGQDIPYNPTFKTNLAPKIKIYDHRGCKRAGNKVVRGIAGGQEYTGPMSNDENDEMFVGVSLIKVDVSPTEAASFLQQVISYQSKGIDGIYRGVGKK